MGTFGADLWQQLRTGFRTDLIRSDLIERDPAWLNHAVRA